MSCWFFRSWPGVRLAHFRVALKSLYQSEAWCKTIHMKRSLIYMWVSCHIHMKGWAPRLVLRKRLEVIRKLPIEQGFYFVQFFVTAVTYKAIKGMLILLEWLCLQIISMSLSCHPHSSWSSVFTTYLRLFPGSVSLALRCVLIETY